MGMPGLLQSFASGTTMHGIPKAIRARSTVGRLFWAVVCLAAASMFFLQFIQLLTKYFNYPKKVTIEVLPLAVPFPSISLCNLRNLDISVLNKLNRIFKEATDPLDWSNYTSDPFLNAYMKTVAKYYPMFLVNDTDWTMFQTVLTRTTVATNMERDLVSRAGVPFKEFIVTCRFAGHGCNRTKDFHQFFDSYYYNCFTYNSPTPENLEDTLAEGLENGWSTTVLTGSGMLETNEDIRMIPGTHELLSPMSSSEGVRVVIHPPGTQPYPHTEGFDVPPGVSATFGVKAMQNIRIGPPHGNCSRTNPFDGDHQARMYRLMSCQKQCLQKAIVESCDCKDIALPGGDAFPETRFCTNDDDIPEKCRLRAEPECFEALRSVYDRMMCARDTAMRMTRNASSNRECGCYPPCNEITYDVTYSLSRWPAESFDGDEAYIDIFLTAAYPTRFNEEEDGVEKLELYSSYFDPTNRRRAMRDFSRLNVYIADSNILKTEESEDYSSSQLLSDIGGQLGLWVGVSVITLAEVLELVMDVCRFICSKHGPYSQGRKFSRDPEAPPPGYQQCGSDPPPASASSCQHCCRCQCHKTSSQGACPNPHGNGVIPMGKIHNEPAKMV